MIIDCRRLDHQAEFSGALCIIGAGAAGITLAKRLSTRLKDVILLESGGKDPEEGIQGLNDGIVDGLPYPALRVARLRYFGGTTNHWRGTSRPFDPIDFEARGWVPDSGWPIPYDDYVRHLREAMKMCEIEDKPFDAQYWSSQPHATPAPDLDESVFSGAIFRRSPPTRFGKVYFNDIVHSRAIRTFFHANVLGLVPDHDGRGIRHVDVGADNIRIRIRARQFILAAGGIENSRILLTSNSLHERGLGNEWDNVGRYFMEHPALDAGTVLLTPGAQGTLLGRPWFSMNGRRLRSDIQLNDRQQRQHQILNHSAYLFKVPEAPGATGRLLSEWSGYSGPTDSIKSYHLRFRFEHAPCRESRISLAEERDAYGIRKPKLSLKVGELEERTLHVFQMEFARQLGRLNQGRMKMNYGRGSSDGWRDKLGWQWHHLGGTRMSAHAKTGVVDANCKVHSLRNLFVAGSSVFPTGGHANPTLNVVALSLRLAEQLIEKRQSHGI